MLAYKCAIIFPFFKILPMIYHFAHRLLVCFFAHSVAKLFTRAIFIVFNPSLPVLFLKHFTGDLTPVTVPKLFLERSVLTFSLQNPIVSSWFSSYLVYKQPFIPLVSQSFLIYFLYLTSRAVHSPGLIFYFLVTSSQSPLMISFFLYCLQGLVLGPLLFSTDISLCW